MKSFLKFIFKFLIIILILIGIPVATLFFLVYDGTDKAPKELYGDDITFQNEIDSLFSRFLINRDGAFYLSFSEEELNRLVFAFIRNLNSSYYQEGCDSDECKYIQSAEIPAGVPVFGGKKVHLRHIYTEIGEDSLKVYLTVIAPYLRTSFSAGIKLEKENGTYIFRIERLALGKMNIASGLGKSIAQPLLSGIGLDEESINRSLEKDNLSLTYSAEDFSFRFEKEALGDIIMKLIGDDDKFETKLMREMVDILSSSENDLLDMGFFQLDNKNHFGFKIDLNAIKTDQELANKLAEKRALAAQGFDVDSFVANKTQTFVIGYLSSGGEKKITFTNQDFNRIIYDQTNGYSQFKYSLTEGGEANFRLTGIFVEFSPTLIKFQFVVEINGVEVLIEAASDIESSPDERELSFALNKGMTIGGIQTSEDFLLELLSGFNSLSAVNYDPETGTFTISVTTFLEFMKVGGPATPLSIEKIKAASGGIEVYVEYGDPGLSSAIEQAKEDLKELLKGDFLDESEFDLSDPAQEELIAELQDALDEIAAILNDPEGELDSEITDNLIALINNLSDENQKILLDQITENANSSDLESLYEQLFGN